MQSRLPTLLMPSLQMPSPQKAFLPMALLMSILVLSPWSAASADAGLARAKGCASCHAAERKLVGPPYKAIAARYGQDRSVVGKLAVKVRQGGVGAWGQIPMPANTHLSEVDAITLVNWILEQQ